MIYLLRKDIYTSILHTNITYIYYTEEVLLQRDIKLLEVDGPGHVLVEEPKCTLQPVGT